MCCKEVIKPKLVVIGHPNILESHTCDIWQITVCYCSCFTYCIYKKGLVVSESDWLLVVLIATTSMLILYRYKLLQGSTCTTLIHTPYGKKSCPFSKLLGSHYHMLSPRFPNFASIYRFLFWFNFNSFIICGHQITSSPLMIKNL